MGWKRIGVICDICDRRLLRHNGETQARVAQAMASDQRKVWTAIADSFDRTRQRPWPHVVRFIEGLPPASRVLDLMCGNGRHAKVAAEEIGRASCRERV